MKFYIYNSLLIIISNINVRIYSQYLFFFLNVNFEILKLILQFTKYNITHNTIYVRYANNTYRCIICKTSLPYTT